MIYLLSDLHADLTFDGMRNYLENATDEDLLIILGDIGLEFDKTEENEKFNKEFLSITKKIAFIDGNHENFEYLNSFPQEEWNGGTVGRLSENIVHLKRGNVYNIGGKTFLVFGGCKSSPKWKEMGRWHPGDEPTDEQLELAYTNLKKHNHQVDYVLTHKYEQIPGRGTVCEKLQEFNKFIDEKVSYKKWYCGHWHRPGMIDEKHILVYNELCAVED